MFVVEAFLSSLFEVVLDKLVATPLLEYARRQKVDTTLQEWRRTLLRIQAVLIDAEQKQISDRAVKLWLVLIPRVFDDPRSCQVDGHVISTHKGS